VNTKNNEMITSVVNSKAVTESLIDILESVSMNTKVIVSYGEVILTNFLRNFTWLEVAEIIGVVEFTGERIALMLIAWTCSSESSIVKIRSHIASFDVVHFNLQICTHWFVGWH
jgi:hypothetical protein